MKKTKAMTPKIKAVLKITAFFTHAKFQENLTEKVSYNLKRWVSAFNGSGSGEDRNMEF